MEQMMECLLAEMKAHLRKMTAMIKTGQELITAEMKAHQEEMKSMREVQSEKMVVN
jgi:hypothetical protein